MGLVQSLDYFVAFCEDEVKNKDMTKKDFNELVKAVDLIQNKMEEVGY